MIGVKIPCLSHSPGTLFAKTFGYVSPPDMHLLQVSSSRWLGYLHVVHQVSPSMPHDALLCSTTAWPPVKSRPPLASDHPDFLQTGDLTAALRRGSKCRNVLELQGELMSQGREGRHFKIPLYRTRNLSELSAYSWGRHTRACAHTHAHLFISKGLSVLKSPGCSTDSAGNGVVPSAFHVGLL